MVMLYRLYVITHEYFVFPRHRLIITEEDIVRIDIRYILVILAHLWFWDHIIGN